jgi:hypothetical protein
VVPLQPIVHEPQWLGSEVSFAQTLPHAVRPLEQVWQVPPMQAAPETHWLAPVPEQAVRQEVLPHRNGLQAPVEPAGQLPLPSQNEAAVLMSVLVLHVAEPHITDVPGIAQVACAPLQVPWQAPVPAHDPCLGVPETLPQVPAGVLLAAMPPQYWQVPLHWPLQQTLSTQKPVRHCVPAEQVWPVFVLQAPVASQVCVPLQVPLASSALVMATQVPFAEAQVWQVPQDAAPQQAPSTHEPLVHSTPDAQALPFPFCGTQVPALQ